MKKKLLTLLLSVAMIIGMLPVTASAHAEDTVLTINGSKYTASKLEFNIIGDGWSWSASDEKLTLDGYNGGYIEAARALNIVLADGTENMITVPSDVSHSGIYTKGSCSISGSGDLNIKVQNSSVLYCGILVENSGSVNIRTDGDLTISAAKFGISAPEGGVLLGGSGDIRIDSGSSSVLSKTNMYISNNGALTVTSGGWGLRTENGDVIINGSGKVYVDSTANNAVYLASSKTCLRLNGQGTPLTFTSPNGKAAVYNNADGTSPVDGMNIAYYDKISGSPDKSLVIYNILANARVTVSGIEVSAANKDDILNDGGSACYDPETGTLTLSGYNGGSIFADRDLTVISKEGTTNTISVPENSDECGITASGSCTINGNGDLIINAPNEDSSGIYTYNNGSIKINKGGALTITAGYDGIIASQYLNIYDSVTIDIDSGADGIYAYNDVSYYGTGDIRIVSVYDGIYSNSGSVNINGYGNIDIDSGSNGINANKTIYLSSGGADISSAFECLYSINEDVIISNGKVTAVSSYDNAVSLNTEGKSLLLEGSGSPLKFTAADGYHAVYNIPDETSPVGGTHFSDYLYVTGAPSEKYVEYDNTGYAYDLIIDGQRFTPEQTESSLTGTGWSWDASKEELTLSGYNSGYIIAGRDITINIAEGTENRITVPEEIEQQGISVTGSCTLTGKGDLNIECLNDSSCGIITLEEEEQAYDLQIDMDGDLNISGGIGIGSNGSISMTGGGSITIYAPMGILAADDISITGCGDVESYSGLYGILSLNGDVLISGSGNIAVDSAYIGICADKDVRFSGSGSVESTGEYYGITSHDSDIVISGSVKVTAAGRSNNAVYLQNSGCSLMLEGSGTPLIFDSAEGEPAIYNAVDKTSPVGGTMLSEYKVTGAPDKSHVMYEIDNVVPVSGVSLNKTKLTLTEGDTEMLTASVMPDNASNKNVTWTSSNDSVASVSETGVVTAVKAGSAVITVTTEDSGKTAECSVAVSEKSAEKLPFIDVKEGSWYYGDVEYVYSNNLMNGTSGDTFEPDSGTTRGMIVTILYRLEGSPAVDGGNAFADVEADKWYTDPIIWANKNGIVNGIDGEHFAPNDAVIREQMAAILYRYAKFKGYDVTKSKDISSFDDASTVSEYAVEAFKWAYACGLINGTSEKTLSPKEGATRAQIAAILHRFCENVK